MRLLKFPTLLVSLLIASCAGMFPGVGILVPETVVGYEMDATGLEGSYYYEFAADGTYERETVLPSGERSVPKKGSWKWERKNPQDAVLTLDDSLVVSLNFTTDEHANATLAGSERLYPVEFTAP